MTIVQAAPAPSAPPRLVPAASPSAAGIFESILQNAMLVANGDAPEAVVPGEREASAGAGAGAGAEAQPTDAPTPGTLSPRMEPLSVASARAPSDPNPNETTASPLLPTVPETVAATNGSSEFTSTEPTDAAVGPPLAPAPTPLRNDGSDATLTAPVTPAPAPASTPTPTTAPAPAPAPAPATDSTETTDATETTETTETQPTPTTASQTAAPLAHTPDRHVGGGDHDGADAGAGTGLVAPTGAVTRSQESSPATVPSAPAAQNAAQNAGAAPAAPPSAPAERAAGGITADLPHADAQQSQVPPAARGTGSPALPGKPAAVPVTPVADQQPAAEPVRLGMSTPMSAPIVTPTAAPAAISLVPAPTSPSIPLSAQLAQPLFSLASAKSGEHLMTVQVTPDNLGPVTVRAMISADDVRIELFSPTEGGRDALRQILADLRRDLAGSGLTASLDLSSKSQSDESHDREPARPMPRQGTSTPGTDRDALPALPGTAQSVLDITI